MGMSNGHARTAKNPKGAGRPTVLDDKLYVEIKALILQDKTFKQIQKETGIPAGTWDRWYYANYEGFQERIDSFKRLKMLRKAEERLYEFATMNPEDEKYAKIVQDTAKFIAETAGKEFYSKRQENTGANGSPLNISLVSFSDKTQDEEAIDVESKKKDK